MVYFDTFVTSRCQDDLSYNTSGKQIQFSTEMAPKWRQNGAKKTYIAPHMTKRYIWRQKDIIWHTDRWQFSTKHHYLVINSVRSCALFSYAGITLSVRLQP